MDFIESFDLFGVDAKQIPSITGEGAPTLATRGAVGCFYMDTLSGEVYKCIAVNGEEFTWNIFSKSNADGTGGGIQTEADPTVPAWAKEPTKPAYTANEIGAISYTEVQALTEDQKAQARSNIGAGESGFSGSYNDLADKPNIPSALSELSDDSDHRTITDEERESWNSKSNFSGSYNDLTDKPHLSTDSQIQADWEQTDSSQPDYINNKIHLKKGDGFESTHSPSCVANNDYSFSVGRYSADSNDALFIVGNGTGDDTRSNAFEVISSDDNKVSIKVGNTILPEEELIKIMNSYGSQSLFITQTERDSMSTPSNVETYAEINKLSGNVERINSYKSVGKYQSINVSADDSNNDLNPKLETEIQSGNLIKLKGYTTESESEATDRFFAVFYLDLGVEYNPPEEWLIYYEVVSSPEQYNFNIKIGNDAITTEPKLISCVNSGVYAFITIEQSNSVRDLVIRFMGRKKTEDEDDADENGLILIDSFVIPDEVYEMISNAPSAAGAYIDFDSKRLVSVSGTTDISEYLTDDNIIEIYPNDGSHSGLIEYLGGEATITFTREVPQ